MTCKITTKLRWIALSAPILEFCTDGTFFFLAIGKKLLLQLHENESVGGKKVTLESSKSIGGIGAILMFIGVLPFFAYTWILELIGLILVLVAAKGFADIYKERGIFNNALYAVLLAIVGAVIAVAVVFMVLLSFLNELGISFMNIQDWSALSGVDWQSVGMNALGQFIGGIVIVLVVVWVFAIITAIFVRRSLGLLSAKSGVGMFGTTGLLVLIGAAIPFFGLFLMWISSLLLAVAFFSVRAVDVQPPQPTAPV